MLDIKRIREETESVRRALLRRGPDAALGLERLLALDAERREGLTASGQLKNRKKTLSAEVGRLKKQGKDASDLMEQVRRINQEIQELDQRTQTVDAALQEALLNIPNTPHESVPDGADESANAEVRRWGEPPGFAFEPRNHVELGEALDILDLKRAAKIAGTRFGVFKKEGAALLRALIQFMLDVQTRDNGYTEVYPPVLVNEASLVGTGQLPKFAEDLFQLREDPFYLIPTAEVPVTNLHREEILEEAALPVRYAAYTACFRREAGSYGKDTQGILRQHQFDKVELVQFAHPDHSWDQLEALVRDAESILQKLELPYRVVNLCAGDLGFSAAKTYDLEVWLPGQNTYREISSCSNFTDYQARRAKIRYRPKGGKPLLLHTLNGSGVAAGRLWIAVVENGQQADGSIRIPPVLQPYLQGRTVIGPSG